VKGLLVKFVFTAG